MTSPQSSSKIRTLWQWLAIALLFLAAVGLGRYFSKSDKSTDSVHAATREGIARPAEVTATLANKSFESALGESRKLPLRLRLPEFGRQLRLWIESDPEAALSYVRRLQPGPEFSTGLLLVLDAISRQNVDRSLQLAGELAASREDRSFYNVLFARLAAEDLPAALGKIGLINPGEGRANAIRAMTDVWSGRDAAGALSWARQLPDIADRAVALESALVTLTDSDPLQAVDLALVNLDGAARSRVVLLGFKSLNETEPAAAASLVAMLPAGELQTQAAIDVARSLTTKDPLEASRWANTLPAGASRTAVIENILSLWVANDAAGAGQFVAQMEPGLEQAKAAAHYAGLLASNNPASAIAWAQTLSDTAARDRALIGAISVWARREPAAAAQWSTSMPPSATQITALNGALSYWIINSPVAVREFVRNLPPTNQAAAAEFSAPLLAQGEPRETLSWAESLSSPAARDAAIAAAYRRWNDNSPVAAREWLARAILPAELKARLQTPTGP